MEKRTLTKAILVSSFDLMKNISHVLTGPKKSFKKLQGFYVYNPTKEELEPTPTEVVVKKDCADVREVMQGIVELFENIDEEERKKEE